MKGNLRQRTKGSWEIPVDIDNDPVSGKRQQYHETVHGNKGKAQTRLSELLTEIALKGYVKTPKDLTVAEYCVFRSKKARLSEQIGRPFGVNRPPFRTKSATP